MSGRKFGIVIGTNEYSDNNIPNLRFAEKDAKEIRNILIDPDICGFSKVTECINDPSMHAFCKIEQLLKKAENDDLLLIYFSGHGEPDPQNDLCLLFNDTKLDCLIPTSLNYSMIRKCIDASSCKTIIVILDCCYSGAAGIKGNNVKEILAKSSGSGIAILSACSDYDTAKEDEELENSVFTYFFIEGLKNGSVISDSNGDIGLVDLYNYVHEKAIARCSQTPYIKLEVEGNILIARNPFKFKEKEFKRKKNELVKNIRKKLPAAVYDVSMIVLVDSYEEPEVLTKTDEEIRKSLDDLLEGKISVKTYIHTVEYYIENEENEDSHVLEKFRNIRIPKIFTSPYAGMEFVLIPEGEFLMGSEELDREQPAHMVKIEKCFYLSKYPVTQRQWKKVMGNNQSNYKGDDRPVERVSWDNVQKFIAELNRIEDTDKYRLPSEAEWEYACRAGTKTRYFFGDDESELGNYAWYSGNSESETHPVGQKEPNPWGLFDVYGNIWEWVQDWWHSTYNSAPSDGRAWEDEPSSCRVVRGGGWSSIARYCRSADRDGLIPGSNYINVGFRLLRKL